jgi:hypothetical protein
MSFTVEALLDDIGAPLSSAALASAREIVPAMLFDYRKDWFMCDCEA